MNVLITGGTGVVGWDLVRESIFRGHETTYTFYENEVSRFGASALQLDIRNSKQTMNAISEIDPTVVIHSAGVADADFCERKPEVAWEINVSGTRNVVRACEAVGCHVLFISSSFVFSGQKNCYYEDDERNPINIYGETKVAAEDITRDLTHSTIVRTDQPYTISEPWQSDTMIGWTLSQLNDNGKINVFDDWINNPICVNDLSSIIFDLAENKEFGIYHGVGPEYISRYKWVKKIASVFGHPSSRIQPTNSDDANLPAERANANLSNQKVLKTVKTKIRPVRECMEELNSS